MDIRELLQKRAGLFKTAKERFDKGYKEKDGLHEVVDKAEAREFSHLCTKINEMNARICQELEKDGEDTEGFKSIETDGEFLHQYNELDSPMGKDHRSGSSMANYNHTEPVKFDGQAIIGKTPRTFKNLFHQGDQRVTLDRGGFKDFNEFLTLIQTGMSDQRLLKLRQEAATQKLTEGGGGGVIVPQEFAAFLWDKSLENEIVRPRATVWPMKTEQRRVPTWNNSDHSSNLYGGIVGQWLGETQDAGNEVEPQLRDLLLEAERFACYAKVSDALLADSEIGDLLSTALIKALGWYLDLAYLTGDGLGKPVGVLNDPALITVSRTTSQFITYPDLCNIFARVAPSCLLNSVWVANQTCIPQLLTLTVEVGDGGTHIPVLTKNNGQFEILTRPVIFSEKVPARGSKGDIGLYDFSQYAIGMRKELSIDRSNAVYWKTSETAYRIIGRVDGQGTWEKPVTPLNGETVSWCVTLGA